MKATDEKRIGSQKENLEGHTSQGIPLERDEVVFDYSD
jgi:hypothetical protein